MNIERDSMTQLLKDASTRLEFMVKRRIGKFCIAKKLGEEIMYDNIFQLTNDVNLMTRIAG